MSLTQKGKLISKGDTQQVSDKFKKREFVIEIIDEINGNQYTNYGKFQLVQNKCDILDRHSIGDAVEVYFNIKGNRWERDGKVNYITNLDAWKIAQAPQVYSAYNGGGQPAHSATPPASNTFAPSSEDTGDLPF